MYRYVCIHVQDEAKDAPNEAQEDQDQAQDGQDEAFLAGPLCPYFGSWKMEKDTNTERKKML